MQLQIQHGRTTRSNQLSQRKYKGKKEATKKKIKEKSIASVKIKAHEVFKIE